MIAGVSIVRDEADVLAVTLHHHLREGFGLLLVSDNGSTDGTREILRSLAAREPRVVWSADASGAEFHQADTVTGLAREAAARGATWVVPFDADELWHGGRRGIARGLAERREAALEVPVVTYVQRRDAHLRRPDVLLGVTHRIAEPIGPPGHPELVESDSISYVQLEYPAKWISRAQPDMTIGPGNHTVGVEGTRGTLDGVRCLHVPMRARAILEKKAEHGRRLAASGYPPLHGWHVQRISRLAEEGKLEREWELNSEQDGVLNAPDGRRVPLVPDTTVRDLVAPIVLARRPLMLLLRRLARRR